MNEEQLQRRFQEVRAAVLALWVLFKINYFGWLLFAWFAIAQAAPAPASPAEPDTIAEDQLGRATPRGAVLGFVKAAQAEDYARAAMYLDVRPGAGQGRGARPRPAARAGLASRQSGE